MSTWVKLAIKPKMSPALCLPLILSIAPLAQSATVIKWSQANSFLKSYFK